MTATAKSQARRSMALIVAVAFVAMLAAGLLGLMIFTRMDTSQTLWNNYNRRIQTVVSGVADIQHHGGYGGFIHHFGNLALTRDLDTFAPLIENDLADLRERFDQLEVDLILPENRERIRILRAAFDSYEKRYRQISAMIAAGRSAQEIAQHGVIRDDAASALEQMLKRADALTAEYEQRATQASDEAHYFLWAGGGLFVFVLLAATLFNLRQVQKLVVANEEIAVAVTEAQRASEAKSAFLSRMSHELRTPLNAILGFSQVLEVADLTPEDADSVQEIRKAGERLLGNVNEMLDLSRIESGRIELNMKTVDVGSVIQNSVAQLSPLARERSILIDTSQAMGEIFVLADTSRLEQILHNLLSNAIKYNKESGRISIVTGTSGERMRIAVSDTGKGIAPENMGKLFRPFERIESAYEGIGGTGIGLAMVKQLTEAMGGEVGVESTEGEGSTFWITFPLAKEPMAYLGDKG